MVLIGLIILFILACVFVALPLWAKLLVFCLNAFFPDPIPIVDEVLMVVAMINDIKKMYNLMKITEWLRTHKAVTICIWAGIIIVIIAILF